MKTVSISGFGGSYEWGCQRMLQLGLEWLKQHPEFSFDKAYRQYQNVTGIAIAENDQAKQLDEAITEDPQLKAFGITGAMHQAVINHLAYIHRNGHEKWLQELAPHRDSADFFEFDGTMESVGVKAEYANLESHGRQALGVKEREKQ